MIRGSGAELRFRLESGDAPPSSVSSVARY